MPAALSSCSPTAPSSWAGFLAQFYIWAVVKASEIICVASQMCKCKKLEAQGLLSLWPMWLLLCELLVTILPSGWAVSSQATDSSAVLTVLYELALLALVLNLVY